MIILLIIISIVIFLLGFVFYNLCWDDIVIGGAFCIGGLSFIICLIVLFVLINDVKQLDIVDKKIQMYQEENNKIESDIDSLISQYIQYEKDTFKNAKSDSSITLVNLYPELKSNELVQEQIKVYTQNNYQIKKLKEDKFDYQLAKWWLYFGKIESE